MGEHSGRGSSQHDGWKGGEKEGYKEVSETDWRKQGKSRIRRTERPRAFTLGSYWKVLSVGVTSLTKLD